MKHRILTLILLTVSTFAFSQDYMDKIALESCECINKVDNSIETDRMTMELGLCMINAATPYKKQLKKDYKIDLNKIDEHGEELGQIIGLRMASVCPETLLRMADIDEETDVDENNAVNFEGQVTSIDDSKFIVFSVKDELGKISKFYWFTFIESNIELSNKYKTLKDKDIQITYNVQDFFDARINEYRSFNIIKSLNVIDK